MAESESCICITKCSTRATAIKYGLDLNKLPCTNDYPECPTYISKGRLLAKLTELEQEVTYKLQIKGAYNG